MLNNDKYLQRSLEPTVIRAAGQFPAVVLTGPRRAGKTTLVRHLFGNTHKYVSFEDMALSEQARTDPNLFFQRFPPPVILDEIQFVPELLRAVKLMVDNAPASKGQFGTVQNLSHFPFHPV